MLKKDCNKAVFNYSSTYYKESIQFTVALVAPQGACNFQLVSPALDAGKSI